MPWPVAEALAAAPQPAEWRRLGQVRHGLTHFELYLDIYAASVTTIAADGFLRAPDDLGPEALPSVMRKCVALARDFAAARRPG
jgi:A/G-specific adenine glycosylase